MAYIHEEDRIRAWTLSLVPLSLSFLHCKQWLLDAIPMSGTWSNLNYTFPSLRDCQVI